MICFSVLCGFHIRLIITYKICSLLNVLYDTNIQHKEYIAIVYQLSFAIFVLGRGFMCNKIK